MYYFGKYCYYIADNCLLFIVLYLFHILYNVFELFMLLLFHFYTAKLRIIFDINEESGLMNVNCVKFHQ